MGLPDELIRQQYISDERRQDFHNFWQARKQVLEPEIRTDPLHKAIRESQDLSRRLTEHLAFLREQAAACATAMPAIINMLTKYAPADNQRLQSACSKFTKEVLNTQNTAELSQQLATLEVTYLDFARCLDELRQALSDYEQ